ncbi:E3 ubiquitin-protein ligase RNF169 isoform X2 [Poecilia reticulata]|uniref:E3 ubiquitin-protein ligase RNF169 isoform X2 n=1 Tax=Poecilia reticulata TaxID=8081 RepID=UPI0004A46C42|nr:PREDICTED: E3 ubiquitin-protein ligase RNF169 isoform X2 [Poecilia reticulata]
MATAGFAEQRSTQAGTAADTSRSRPGTAGAARCRSGSGPPEKCSACPESRSGSGTACSRCLARRVPGREERIRRRSDPERGSSRAGKRDSESRRGVFVCPTLPKSADAPAAPAAKLKLLASDDREEIRRWSCLMGKDESLSVRRAVEPGVLSDSENEEPISRRIRNISAFIRKTKNSSAVSSGSRRSRSCTDPLEDRGGKMKAIVPPAAVMEQVGISHSSAAGILLSSENSRSISAPITAPDRRLTWRAVLTSSAPLGLPPPPARAERSISPESNDSISEELNHFKPIVCSPCTPPKRLPDGRLLEPTVVKATPRNLSRSLQKATSYEASPAVLQKWRQIELDRQGLKVSTRATLTSPAPEPEGGGASKALQHRGAVALANRRRLLFEPPDLDGFQKQSVKIRVPAVRYGSGAALRGCSDLESAGAALEPGGGPAPFGRKHSFSPCNNSGFRPGKLVPKDSLSPRKEWDGICNQSTSRRGKKRNQKTKHLDPALDPALKRSRPSGQQEAPCPVQQERQDRALALRLQRQFDLEVRRASPDRYFLRSWRSTQNRRRRGLRTSRPISKKL